MVTTPASRASAWTEREGYAGRATRGSAGGHMGTRSPGERDLGRRGYAGVGSHSRAHRQHGQRTPLSVCQTPVVDSPTGVVCRRPPPKAVEARAASAIKDDARTMVRQALAQRLALREEEGQTSQQKGRAARGRPPRAAAVDAESILADRPATPVSGAATVASSEVGAHDPSADAGAHAANGAAPRVVRIPPRMKGRAVDAHGAAVEAARGVEAPAVAHPIAATQHMLIPARPQQQHALSPTSISLPLLSSELRQSESRLAEATAEAVAARDALVAHAATENRLTRTVRDLARELDASVKAEQASRDEAARCVAERAELEAQAADCARVVDELTAKLADADDATGLRREVSALKKAAAAATEREADLRAEIGSLQHALGEARTAVGVETAAKRKAVHLYQLTKVKLDAERGASRKAAAAAEEEARRTIRSQRQRLDALRGRNEQLEAQALAATASEAQGASALTARSEAVSMLADEHLALSEDLERARAELADAEDRVALAEGDAAAAGAANTEGARRETMLSTWLRVLLAELREDDAGVVPLITEQTANVAALQARFSALQRSESQSSARSAALQQQARRLPSAAPPPAGTIAHSSAGVGTQVESLLAQLSSGGAEVESELSTLRHRLNIAARKREHLTELLEQERSAHRETQRQLCALEGRAHIMPSRLKPPGAPHGTPGSSQQGGPRALPYDEGLPTLIGLTPEVTSTRAPVGAPPAESAGSGASPRHFAPTPSLTPESPLNMKFRRWYDPGNDDEGGTSGSGNRRARL